MRKSSVKLFPLPKLPKFRINKWEVSNGRSLADLTPRHRDAVINQLPHLSQIQPKSIHFKIVHAKRKQPKIRPTNRIDKS